MTMKKVIFSLLGLAGLLTLYFATGCGTSDTSGSEKAAMKAPGPTVVSVLPDTVFINTSWPGGMPRFVDIKSDGYLVVNYDFSTLNVKIWNLGLELGGDSFEVWKDFGVSKLNSLKVDGKLECLDCGTPASNERTFDVDKYPFYWWMYNKVVTGKHCRFTLHNTSGKDIKVVLLHRYASGS